MNQTDASSILEGDDNNSDSQTDWRKDDKKRFWSNTDPWASGVFMCGDSGWILDWQAQCDERDMKNKDIKNEGRVNFWKW